MSEDELPEVMRRWARHPRCVGLARMELRKTLAGWGLVVIEDAALIALSELVTNAVRHARVSPGREIETHCLRASGGVRIEVHDAADAWPENHAIDSDSEDGWLAGRG